MKRYGELIDIEEMSFFAGELYIFFFENTELFYYFYILAPNISCKKATQLLKSPIKLGYLYNLEKNIKKN